MIDKSKFFNKKIILKYESQTLGHLEFRFISAGDTNFFEKLLKEKLSDKEFSTRVIYNQLDTELQYDRFLFIDENELREILSLYAEKSKSTDKYFLKINSSDEFYRFRKSIELVLEQRKEFFLALSKSISNPFQEISKSIQESLSFKGIIPEITIPKIVFPKIEIPDSLFDLSKHFHQFNVSLSHQISKQSKIWHEFSTQYEKDSKIALKKLRKYNWFINNSMPAYLIPQIAKVKNAKEMKELFISFHREGKYRILDEYLLDWKKNPLIKKRSKILSDAIRLFKDNIDSQKVNINNIVIPALINQIEGLRQDYLLSRGIVHEGKNRWQDPNTNQFAKWTIFYDDALKNPDEFIKLTFDIFSKILFQRDKDKAPIINFSRHKISHGEITRYGTLETTIRCFMILDFFSELP